MNASSPCDVDVVVVGAGPTGLTAACEAARHGLTVRIFDRKAQRSTYSKALVMHARTLEAFEVMGIADRFVDAGTVFAALNVRFGGSAPIRVDLRGLDWGDTKYPYWLSMPQYETERFLEERLGELGVAVDWSTSLTGIEQHDGSVTVTCRRVDGAEEAITARWVIGCDGGRSLTRELLGLEMRRESLGETFVLADVKTRSDLVQDEGYGWYSARGLLLVVPMPEPDLFRVIAHMPHLPPDETLAIDAPFLDALIHERTGIGFGSHDVAWTSQFVLHQGVSDRYRCGRVFLAGDAAHVHSPVGGQGMNTGIQDAHNLLWKLALARRLGEDEAEPYLRSYEEERQPIAEKMVRGTSRATRLLTSTGFVSRFFVTHLGRTAASTRRVQQGLGRGVGMLDLAYRGSAILPPSRASRSSSVAPGRRVPNTQLTPEARLHDLLDPDGHTLFIFGQSVQRVTTSSIAHPVDTAHEDGLRRAFGMSAGGVVLVRPDRIVAGAWAGEARDADYPVARHHPLELSGVLPAEAHMWILLTLLAACGQPAHDPAHHEGELHAAAPGTTMGLSLDHGARWKMDPHTRAVLAETRATLAGAEVGSVDEGKALGARLQAQLDRLIQGCTMTGAAHDQLHGFLTVYMPAVASLSQATELAAVETQVASLRAMVAEYDRFFE